MTGRLGLAAPFPKRAVELDECDTETLQLIADSIGRFLRGAGQQAQNNREEGYRHDNDALNEIGCLPASMGLGEEGSGE
jgi:hypothetical protein